MRSLPTRARAHRPCRAPGQRRRDQPRRAPRRREHQQQRHHQGHRQQPLIQQPGAGVAEPHRQRDLLGFPVGRNVAQVVGDQHRRRQRPDGHRERQADPVDPARLCVLRAEHRDQTEEHEHRDLAQPQIPVRLRAAGVEPRARDAQPADHDQPRRADHGQRQARHGRDPEAHQRRGEHRTRCRQPGSDQPQRSGADVVGAADAVGVVVGVVDPDDHCDRDDQRQQGLPPHRAVQPGRGTGPRDHRGNGIGQCPRAGTLDPLRDTGHERHRFMAG